MSAGVLTMSHEELDRVKLITQIQERRLTVHDAAAILSISERQLYRVLKRYHDQGEPGLIHRLRGKPSNRGYSKELQKTVLDLYWAEYRDYGPTLFTERLLEYHNIKLDHDTVRRWLNANGGSNVQRKRRPHRQRRERRAGIGELVQFDGSVHDWLEGRGPVCCLLHAIDDATGTAFLRFVPSENAADVMLTLWTYCERFGVPRALYIDKTGIFRSPKKVLADAGRAMVSLGTELIFADSPQAKGRVERGHRTHQDRLVKALRQEGISTIADANRFLEEVYTPDHNRRFAIHDPQIPNVFRPLPDGIDLANVFCFQTRRQIHRDYTISLDRKFVQLHAFLIEEPLPPPLQYVIVRSYLKDNSLHIFFNEHVISYSILGGKPKASRPVPRKAPPPHHPWRRKGQPKQRSLLQKINHRSLDKHRKSCIS